MIHQQKHFALTSSDFPYEYLKSFQHKMCIFPGKLLSHKRLGPFNLWS